MLCCQVFGGSLRWAGRALRTRLAWLTLVAAGSGAPPACCSPGAGRPRHLATVKGGTVRVALLDAAPAARKPQAESAPLVARRSKCARRLRKRLTYFWKHLARTSGEACTPARLARLVGPEAWDVTLELGRLADGAAATITLAFRPPERDGDLPSLQASLPGAAPSWEKPVRPNSYLDLATVVGCMLQRRLGWGALQEALDGGGRTAHARSNSAPKRKREAEEHWVSF